MEKALLLYRVMLLMQGYYPSESKWDDAVFVFGRSQGDWEGDDGDTGLIQLAARFWHQRQVSFVAIPGYEGTLDPKGTLVPTGYPGYSIWQRALIAMGVNESVILPTEGGGSNTKTEGDDFIRLAKER